MLAAAAVLTENVSCVYANVNMVTFFNNLNLFGVKINR